MKPYMNLNGKGLWKFFWEGRGSVKRKIKRIFKKSARQQNKKKSNHEQP